MDIKISGKKVKLINTVAADIDQIISFETQNSEFVYIYSREKHLALLNDDNCIHLSIRNLDNGILVGHIILFGYNSKDKALEFGRITIAEKGRGYGRDAVVLIKKLCFEELGFHRLWLDVYDDNQRAIKLYESEGFLKEGVLRDSIKTDDGYRSIGIYSMLEDEYISWLSNHTK